MSKLTAFISKSKKKAAPKATAAAESNKTASSTNAPKTSGAPIDDATPVLDVVQPKVLEQWRVDEDDVSEEVSAAVESRVRVSALDGEDDDDDGEVDLPSSKVKGNFEWKKKTDETAHTKTAHVKKEEPVVPVEDDPKSIGGILRFRRKDVGVRPDLENPDSFPELKQPTSGTETAHRPAVSSTSTGTNVVKKSKGDTSTAKPNNESVVTSDSPIEESQPISAVEKLLTADDIWSVLKGKWASKWGRIAVDETMTRNRFQRMQFLTD